MVKSMNMSFIRFAAIALTVAGILFIFYPSLRPFSDEVSFSGAGAFASTAWIVSHSMAILAFILLSIALLGLYLLLQNNAVEKLARFSLLFTLVGTGLTLPYYGTEVFGLHAIGQEAINRHDSILMSLANAVRFGPGFMMIVAGLLFVAAGSVMTATAVWKSRKLPKWSGIPFTFGFLLYLPQFLGTQPIRILHGATIAVGCIWMAVGIWQQSRQKDKTNAPATSTL